MNTVLWIDREHAKLFNMDSGKLTMNQLHPHDPEHHTHKHDQDEKDSARFFKSVHEQLKNKKEVIILGPGLTKKHFQTYLETHDPACEKRVLKYITTDHPTDHQIAEYFKLFQEDALGRRVLA